MRRMLDTVQSQPMQRYADYAFVNWTMNYPVTWGDLQWSTRKQSLRCQPMAASLDLKHGLLTGLNDRPCLFNCFSGRLNSGTNLRVELEVE